MKIKLIKKTSTNGDIFYRIEKDDSYINSSTCWGGNIKTSTPDELINYYEEAYKMYDFYVKNYQLVEIEETILETSI